MKKKMEEEKDKQNTQPLRDSIQIMLDWVEPIRELPANDFRSILLAIVDFSCYGKSPELSKASPQTKMAWSFIYPQIKRMNDHYAEIAAKRSASGKMGGRPPKANISDEADSSEEEPPNTDSDIKQKKQTVFEESKKSKRFFDKAKKAIREDKIREDNNKENKSQDKIREGKSSAPFDEEGAYSPSSLMNIFDFISPSLSSSFSRWIQYLNRKDRKLMPKTAEAYKAEYTCLVSLSKGNPDRAKQIVENSIQHKWAKLYPLKKPPFSLSPIDIGHVGGDFEPPRNSNGELEF